MRDEVPEVDLPPARKACDLSSGGESRPFIQTERQYRGDRGRSMTAKEVNMVQQEEEPQLFVGIDWGSETHVVQAVNEKGQRCLETQSETTRSVSGPVHGGGSQRRFA